MAKRRKWKTLEVPAGKSTIDELEKILDSEEDTPLTIMPDGSVCVMDGDKSKPTTKKPITMRENIGGEYGQADSHS